MKNRHDKGILDRQGAGAEMKMETKSTRKNGETCVVRTTKGLGKEVGTTPDRAVAGDTTAAFPGGALNVKGVVAAAVDADTEPNMNGDVGILALTGAGADRAVPAPNENAG